MHRGKVHTMRAWIQRRESVGTPWNADELWARILVNWPRLSEEDRESIFQDCVRGTDKVRRLPVGKNTT